MLSAFILCLLYLQLSSERTLKQRAFLQSTDCSSVCRDLPPADTQPVCMMVSRYKKGYLYYANQCQARRAMCMENFVMNMVHWKRCHRSGLYFMPIPANSNGPFNMAIL